MADGIVLDVQPDPRGRHMVVWLKTAKGALRLPEPYTPTVHVRAHAGGSLDALEADLAPLPTVGAATRRVARCGLEDDDAEVLAVPVLDHRLVPRVAALIDEMGDHHRYEVFDADLRVTSRFLHDKGLWPFASVRAWTAGRYRLRDPGPRALTYPDPGLTTLQMGVGYDVAAGTIPDLATPLKEAWVEDEDGGFRRFTGTERDVLEGLHGHVADTDPDVVLTRGGDTFLLPHLRARAARLDVTFHIGREPDPPLPKRRGRSYFTYGRIKYQPTAATLRGRLHIDTAASFFHAEAGLAGLVDLARLSRVPLQELARLGAGTALTAIQVGLAQEQGRLIPWLKSTPERFKTARDLLRADRGGHIYEPRVGLHEDVVELDFASLYPNIMVTRNISPETILCGCCDPGTLPLTRRVPQLGTWTCGKREGFIPAYLAPVVARREHAKRQRSLDPANRERHQQVSDVYKWLLVTSFGYQGYKNAKFGRIECHEAIGAWGREVLLTTADIARDHGFEVIHGIVDSLWLERRDPHADEHAFADHAAREIGIPLEVEGRYKWIVFLPARSGNPDPHAPQVGALNRYYGCLDKVPAKPSRSQAGQPLDYLAGGALKVRGVELRQHSTPPVLRAVQEAFLQTVAPAADAAGFRALLPYGVDAAAPILRRIADGECTLDELMFTSTVSRDAGDYRTSTCVSAAARQLARRGVHVPPGDLVHYVILDEASRDPEGKVVEARLVKGDEAYDRDAYLRHASRAVESLTLPFKGLLDRRRGGRRGTRPLPGLGVH